LLVKDGEPGWLSIARTRNRKAVGEYKHIENDFGGYKHIENDFYSNSSPNDNLESKF
jgi:hypothetical protein